MIPVMVHRGPGKSYVGPRGARRGGADSKAKFLRAQATNESLIGLYPPMKLKEFDLGAAVATHSFH